MTDVKAIAIYLPQFHPIPENDEWWGKGFTEWTNVTKSRPLFPGHYQPHLPADLGFYDLRVPETRDAQAKLAQSHGIHAFCYYHYWFNGRKLLDLPMRAILSSGEPNFPFCICWANENWTKAWDGAENQIILKQSYSPEDDRLHIQDLIPVFSDPRYLRIDGKIAFFVYRTGHMPDPASTARIWREEIRLAGLGDLFLGEIATSRLEKKSDGFDAVIEFVPNRYSPPKANQLNLLVIRVWCRIFARLRGTRQAAIHFYKDLVEASTRYVLPDGVSPKDFFRCVTPGWDNTSRRKNRPIMFLGSTPERYERWLRDMVRWTRKYHSDSQRYIFINAWNEWAEGNHLEPDRLHGLAYLEATARAMKDDAGADDAVSASKQEQS